MIFLRNLFLTFIAAGSVLLLALGAVAGLLLAPAGYENVGAVGGLALASVWVCASCARIAFSHPRRLAAD